MRAQMPAQQEASPALLPSTPPLLPSTSADAFTPEASCGDEGCWPSMYLVGAQKASTTALFQLRRQQRHLRSHTSAPGLLPGGELQGSPLDSVLGLGPLALSIE